MFFLIFCFLVTRLKSISQKAAVGGQNCGPLQGCLRGKAFQMEGTARVHSIIQSTITRAYSVWTGTKSLAQEQKEVISNTDDFRAHGKEMKGLVLNELISYSFIYPPSFYLGPTECPALREKLGP